MIQINNLSKSYGSNQVLRDINVHFEKGMVYGIVGKNGSGKTTLFRCIAGLEKYEGSIVSGIANLKSEMGLLFTEPYFFNKITAKEYIRLLCNARGKQIEDIDQRNIFDLPLQQYASAYSTGMKKKLALLAILMQENSCYILDEPFNGVDIQSNILIEEIILKLKSLGKTVLISSHIFSTLHDTCDEIWLLDNGQFERKVHKVDFDNLEQEMKLISIGNKIEALSIK